MNIESPITMTPTQVAMRNQKRADIFLKEYERLCTRHKLKMVAIINPSPQGILPEIRVTEKEAEAPQIIE